MENTLHMLLQAVQVFLILVRAASQPVNIGSTVRDYKGFSLKSVHSALAQSPSLLPDGFKVHQAQPIRCDFSKLDYKLCYSEILVNCSNSCIHCKLQSVSVTEKSCFQSCPFSCPSVVAINRLIRLYCRCI